MKWNVKIVKNMIACFCLLLFGFVISPEVQAAEASGSRSLILFHAHEDGGSYVTDVEFSLYYVADEAGNLAGAFKDYQVSLEETESTGLKNTAETLEGYTIKDKIVPLDSAKTDENGIAVFPASDTLEEGIYLITGKSYSTDTYICNIEPFLISLPNKDRDINIESKFELYERDLKLQMRVVKIWKDQTTSYRPSEIEAELIDESGNIYETVILNQENNWRYVWDDLPEGHVWSVIEKDVPEYYTVSSERDGLTVHLTNTSEKEDTPTEGKLPQTGILWWPVPVLAAAGLICIVLGLIRRQKDE